MGKPMHDMLNIIPQPGEKRWPVNENFHRLCFTQTLACNVHIHL